MNDPGFYLHVGVLFLAPPLGAKDEGDDEEEGSEGQEHGDQNGRQQLGLLGADGRHVQRVVGGAPMLMSSVASAAIPNPSHSSASGWGSKGTVALSLTP